jgi:biopolymer transport protein ExbD
MVGHFWRQALTYSPGLAEESMRAEKPLDLTVPITPMLDMAFQLLAFFVLTFRVAPTEGQIEAKLPPAGPPVLKGDPADLDTRDVYRLKVDAAPTGEIALIRLAGPARTEGEVARKELLAQLQALPRPSGGVAITIESSRDLHYSQLMEIMDVCKKAGHAGVGLAPLQ